MPFPAPHSRLVRIAVLLGFAGACAMAMAAPKQVTLTVPTMDCATCPITIRAALLKVPGVRNATVSYARRTAKVAYDDARTNVATLTKATAEAGYPSFAADER